MSPDLIGWFACFLLGLGTVMLYFKQKFGWIVRAFGDLYFALVGILVGLPSLIFCEIAFFLIDIIGYFMWRDNENAKRKS
jgi:hypothetical protein